MVPRPASSEFSTSENLSKRSGILLGAPSLNATLSEALTNSPSLQIALHLSYKTSNGGRNKAKKGRSFFFYYFLKGAL